MLNDVIFTNPVLWGGYSIALIFCLLNAFNKSMGFIFTIISVLLVVVTTTYALFLGAELYDIGMIILLFFTINIMSYIQGKRGGEQ